MAVERYTVSGIYVERADPAGGATIRPPLLMIHGAFMGAWCWENWLAALPEHGWTGYAVSLRNHPGSRPVDDQLYRTRQTLADYLEDVSAVAAHIGRPCIPVGHSLGGILAQMYAAAHTRQGTPVPGLVLMASVPPRPLGPLRTEPVSLDTAYLPPRSNAWAGDDPVLDGILRPLTPESPSVMNEYSLGPGVPVERTLIRCPMLVVSAERDTTV
ncbi:MAG: alpha/beta hydrolase, partial [Candidatus Methylomirabilia bacterium]